MKNQQIIFALSVFIFLTANISAQTGGTFAITQSVVAGGGSLSNGGTFSVNGTAGQAFAGNTSGASSFAVTSGFWNFTALAPTAAGASLSGRVITDGGKGIRNVLLTLVGTGTGEIYYARSGFFGNYRFEAIPTGQSYILTASARRFTFVSNTQIISLVEDLANINFVGAAQF